MLRCLSTLTLPLLLLLLLLLLSARGADDVLTCDSMSELEYGRLVALDAQRLVFEALHHSVPLLVSQPYNGTHWKSAPVVAPYVALFADEQRDTVRLKEPMLPHAYGGCFGDLQSTRAVREYVVLWPSVCADARLSVDQRLQIAANALELARWFDSFPLYRDGSRRRVVATRLQAAAVGVSAYYVPKLHAMNAPDALGLEPYDAASPLLGDEPCVTDHDCSYAVLVERQFMRSFKNVAALPQEFRCNMRTHRCHGLDSGANAMTICRVLLEPLLGLGGHRIPVPLDAKREHLLGSIVTACQFGAREDRPSVDELQSTLRSMIGAAVPPYMTPRNADLAQFFQLNATHQLIADGDTALGLLPADDAKKLTAALPPPLSGSKLLERLADVVHPPHNAAAAAAAAAVKLNVSRWFFDFSRADRAGHEARSLLSPPIRLFGYALDAPYASSPIYSRVDSRRVLTHSGSVYRVDGKLDCEAILRRSFSKSTCTAFADGFPDSWSALLAAEYERMYTAAADAYYGRYAPKTAIDFRYEPPTGAVLAAAATAPTLSLSGAANLAQFRDAVDDGARSAGDGDACTPGELGCMCRTGLCVQGAVCTGNLCMMAQRVAGSTADADPLGAEAHSLTAEQLFSLRVLAQSAPCASASATACAALRVRWRDPAQLRGDEVRVLAPCQWVPQPAPGRCVHAENVRFVDKPGDDHDVAAAAAAAVSSHASGALVGEIVPPRLPPHVVPLIGGALPVAAASAQPRCVTTANGKAQDLPLNDVSAVSPLVEQTVAVRLNRAAVELAVGVSASFFGAQLTKYAAVARIRRDGVVEAATGGGQAPRADMALALQADVYYALRFTLDIANQNFSLAVVDARRNGGVPLLIAQDVPFLSQSKALAHVGVIELSAGDGAVVCVYQPVPVALQTAGERKAAPSLMFAGAAIATPPALASPPASARPRTACCGNACTCCIFEHVKWDVLAYFAERYGLRPADCSMHDEVRTTFCRSTPQFSCEHCRQEQCLFACKNE
jgi:hypothetical protein